jgi:hypothetical protein
VPKVPLGARAIVGVVAHAPPRENDRLADDKDGVVLYVEVADGLKTYRLGGRDLLSNAVKSAPSPQRGPLQETWEIVVEGQMGYAIIGTKRFRFRMGPTGGHVAFFNLGEDNASVSALLRKVGTASVPKTPPARPRSSPAIPASPRELNNPINLMPRPRPPSPSWDNPPAAMERALVLARSMPDLHDFGSTRMANYATKKPAKVFMPALALMLDQKRHVFEPQKKNPWTISGHYQEDNPYASLIKQREEAKKKQPLTVKLKRRRRKVEGEAIVDDDDDDLEDDSPEKRLGKSKCAELRELFAKFDKYDNGWADCVDLPNIFMTYLGYRHPPTRITAAAVKMVTTYTAVEIGDFFGCFLNFCELEEEDDDQIHRSLRR